MRFYLKRTLILAGASCLALGMLSCTWGADSKADSKKAKIQEQIGEKQKEIKSLNAQSQKVLEELESAQVAMAEAQKRANALKKNLEKTRGEIALAKSGLEQVTQRVKQTEEYASLRLVEYYKLTQTGVAPVILGSVSVFEASVRQDALRRIIALDNRVWENLVQDKARLSALAATLEKGHSEQIVLERELEAELARLDGQKAEKKKLLAQVKREKGLAQAAMKSLKQAAEELSKAITRMKPVPAKPPKPSQVPTRSFASVKGKLQMPVQRGRILTPFGTYEDPQFKTTEFRSGVDISGERGEPFRAVHGGQVAYSGWFKGYGNMIIIDHGDSYFSVSAHAEDLFKKKGQPVESGEAIGTVGDSGSFSGPGLYFEIRHHSTPLDPAVWLGKDH